MAPSPLYRSKRKITAWPTNSILKVQNDAGSMYMGYNPTGGELQMVGVPDNGFGQYG